MTEEAGAVVGRERTESSNQGVLKVVESACRRLTQMGLQFGKSQFDGIEIGAVRRQIPDAGSPGRDQFGDVLDFVGGEVIEDDGVTLAQFGTEDVLQISGEDIGIDGSFDQEGGRDTFMAQGGDKRRGLPVTMRDGAAATLSHRAAPIAAAILVLRPVSSMKTR